MDVDRRQGLGADIRMWYMALRIIPHLDKNEWDALDPVSKWLVVTRGAVLIMTFFSAIIGGLLAFSTGPASPLLLLVAVVGLVLAHGASNLLNDYWDTRLGVDEGNYFRAQYGPHPLIGGFLTNRQILKWVTATLAVAALAGAYLTLIRGPWVVLFALAGLLLMMMYSGKPFPLKRVGLGEIAVFIIWGPLMIGGTFFVLQGVLPLWVILASFPYTLGVTLVLFGKHIDKMDYDREKSIRTLPVILGERWSRRASVLLIVLMFATSVLLVLYGFLGLPVLLVFFSIPSAIAAARMFSKPRPLAKPEGYPSDAWPLWFVGFSFVFNRNFGALFVLGLILDIALRIAGLPVFLSGF